MTKSAPNSALKSVENGTLQTVRIPDPALGLSGRYARAIYTLAVEKKKLKDLLAELASFKDFFAGDLQNVLTNPRVDQKVKDSIIADACKSAKFSEMTSNFLRLVVREGRAEVLPAMIKDVFSRDAADRQEISATVYTVEALSASQRKSVEAFVKGLGSDIKSVAIDEKIDPRLIAGLKIRVGSNEYDLSVRGKLSQLKRQLTLAS